MLTFVEYQIGEVKFQRAKSAGYVATSRKLGGRITVIDHFDIDGGVVNFVNILLVPQSSTQLVEAVFALERLKRIITLYAFFHSVLKCIGEKFNNVHIPQLGIEKSLTG